VEIGCSTASFPMEKSDAPMLAERKTSAGDTPSDTDSANEDSHSSPKAEALRKDLNMNLVSSAY
jgi:hypothetical protein